MLFHKDFYNGVLYTLRIVHVTKTENIVRIHSKKLYDVKKGYYLLISEKWGKDRFIPLGITARSVAGSFKAWKKAANIIYKNSNLRYFDNYSLYTRHETFLHLFELFPPTEQKKLLNKLTLEDINTLKYGESYSSGSYVWDL